MLPFLIDWLEEKEPYQLRRITLFTGLILLGITIGILVIAGNALSEFIETLKG